MYFSVSPLAPENLISRDRFGRAVQRQPAQSPHPGTESDWLVLTHRISPAFREGVCRQPLSGRSRLYWKVRRPEHPTHTTLELCTAYMNRNSCDTAGRPGSSEVPRNPLSRWDVSLTPANGIFLTKKLKNKTKKMPNDGWRTIKSLVHKIRLHGRRGKGMAESFSREK